MRLQGDHQGSAMDEGAGFQVLAFDDRLFGQVMVFNPNETQTANLRMDDMKGLQVGAWYDIGGTWDEARKRWNLFGDGLSDIDYSCNPVARIGFETNLAPMDRRSLFADTQLNRVNVTSPAPGGSSILSVLNGGGRNQNVSGSGVSPFSLDKLDEAFDEFVAVVVRLERVEEDPVVPVGLAEGEPQEDGAVAHVDVTDLKAEADRLREEIRARGWEVRDGPAGPELLPRS